MAGPACVVDVRLSLGASGLYWVLGLARSLPVWLPQTHWAIVEDPFYLDQEPLVRWLARGVDAGACRSAVAETCESWREARRHWSLPAWPNLYWSGERPPDSVQPKSAQAGVGPDVSEVCDALATGLDRRRGRSPATVDALADCARDTLALAAALGGARPIVLTTLGDGETEPLLVRSLTEARVLCRWLDPGAARWLDDALAPALIETGLRAALAAGAIRLAALQIVAPRAGTAPPTRDEDNADSLAWNAIACGDEEHLWAEASGVGTEVRCA